MVENKVKIIGNGHVREITEKWELPAEVRADFDWADEFDEFFRYRGEWYCLADFMRPNGGAKVPDDHPFKGFDGYKNDSAFSGVLVKRPNHNEVKVYTFTS